MHDDRPPLLRSCRRARRLAGASLARRRRPPRRRQLSFRVGPGGQFQPMPIAIADFAGEGDLGAAGRRHHHEQPQALRLFRAARQGALPGATRPSTPRRASRPGRPRARRRSSRARVSRDPSGRLKAEFRLWDVISGQQIAGQQYFTDPNIWRRVGHIISDAVYTKITGFGGFFDTRVVFVDESGPKENRRKRLAIMDQDGANVRYLTQGDNLVVTPRYSPATQDIAYMSQTTGQQPRVQVINLETGARQVVGNFPDMTPRRASRRTASASS